VCDEALAADTCLYGSAPPPPTERFRDWVTVEAYLITSPVTAPRVNKEVLVAELLSLVSRAFPVTHGKGPLELGHRGW
jgi:hypothetical protein